MLQFAVKRRIFSQIVHAMIISKHGFDDKMNDNEKTTECLCHWPKSGSDRSKLLTKKWLKHNLIILSITQIFFLSIKAYQTNH